MRRETWEITLNKKGITLFATIILVLVFALGFVCNNKNKVVVDEEELYTAEELNRIEMFYESAVEKGQEDGFYFYKDARGHLWVGIDYTKLK